MTKPRTTTRIKDLPPAQRPLTRKQKLFADTLIQNPKLTGTEIVQEIYNTSTKNAATVIASDNLTKANIQLYLAKHDVQAQETITEMMLQREDKRLAFDAAKDIQDRLHGKAKQAVDINSTSVSLTIDLTSALDS